MRFIEEKKKKKNNDHITNETMENNQRFNFPT